MDFMKKAQEAADKVMGVAEEKLGKAKIFLGDKTEVLKLEWELSRKQSMLDALLLEYGKLCYYADTSAEDSKQACYSALVEVEAGINQIEAELLEIKEATKKTSDKKAVYCTKCGAEYKNQEKYCKDCGNKLG